VNCIESTDKPIEDGNDNEDYEVNKDDKYEKNDEDDEDDEDSEDNDNDNEDNDDNDDDVGCFSNEGVEGGVPCAPHLAWIKRLHILNQTPSYRRSDAEKDEIDHLMKKLQQMKSRGIIGGTPCGLGTSWAFKKNESGKHSIGKIVGNNLLWRYTFAW
jgi:hypothetical protein